MNDKEFEAYLKRIEEIYDIESLADDGIPAHLYNPEYREEKIKQILEEIESNAIKKAPRHELQVELFEIDEPF